MSTSDKSATQPTIVDIYCRVSTDPQEDNTSLDEQEAVSRDYCREHGLIVGMVHRETFTGFQYRERKKLTLLRERYLSGKTQGVVVRTFDRLSRKEVHFGILLEEMEHNNVQLHCVKEVLEDSLIGRITRLFLGFLAEWEWEKIRERTTTGRINKANAGKLASGKNPRYGWKWHDPNLKDYLVLDPKPAAVIRWAGWAYARGVACLTLVKKLVERGVPPPSGEGTWTPRTLRRLLTDKRNTGVGAQIFTTQTKKAKQTLDPIDLPDGTYPAIFSEAVYERILARADANREEASRNGKNPGDYLLRAGFIRCADCGRAMVGVTVRDNRRQTEWLAYICQKTKVCQGHRVPSQELDRAVWGEMVKLADYIPLIEQAITLATNMDTTAANLNAVEAALVTWRQSADNFTEDLKDHSLRGETRASIRKLLDDAEGMITELETERKQLLVGAYDKARERQAYQGLLAWCKQVKEARAELSYQQKRDFLRMLGVVVLVDRRNRKFEDMSYDIRVSLPSIQEVIYQHSPIAGQFSMRKR
jgi:DNA invertase Pin-like site-specific DNA recombinase